MCTSCAWPRAFFTSGKAGIASGKIIAATDALGEVSDLTIIDVPQRFYRIRVQQP